MPRNVTRFESARAAVGRLAVPVLVALGAVAGANLRHAVALGLPGPGGTLAANAVGSVLLGALLSEAGTGSRASREVRLLLGTGLLSSFTTYSTFALDVATAPPAVAVGYVVATYGLGFVGVVVGLSIARFLWGTGP